MSGVKAGTKLRVPSCPHCGSKRIERDDLSTRDNKVHIRCKACRKPSDLRLDTLAERELT